jgi:hypothetical protein
MIRIEVQTQTQAEAVLYGLNSAIKAQSEFLATCSDEVVEEQAKAFVWLRENYTKVFGEYPPQQEDTLAQ